MNNLIGQVFKFLWVAVWGKINVWQFLTLNKHYVILTLSNILLSLLFIYMAEQTTVRTDQYRTLKQELESKTQQVKELTENNVTLEANIATQRTSFGLNDVEVDTTLMLKEYDEWAVEVTKMNKEVVENQARRLGEIRERKQFNRSQ